MNVRIKPLCAALCFGMVFSLGANVHAQQTSSLEDKVSQLEQEIKSLRQNVRSNRNSNANVGNGFINMRNNDPTNNGTNPVVKATGKRTQAVQETVTPTQTVDATTREQQTRPMLSSADLLRMVSEQQSYLPFDLDVPGQAFVSTGPYVGIPIQYSGSNLIVNSPSVNTDVQLLTIRKRIHAQLSAMGGQLFTQPYHSHLLLSGVVEAQMDYADIGGGPNTSGIDLTNVSLDAFFIGPSDWTLGFIAFSYDNGNFPFSRTNYFYRVANSRVFVDKAFITIGDFDYSPLYGSVGQYYVPFGTFSSSMISDTLPKLIARTKARAITLGFQQQGTNAFYGSLYFFRGDSHASSVSRINNGGLNLGYQFGCNKFHGNIGGGIIANIADSGGMQLGNGFIFAEQLVHRVPAYDLRFLLNIGDHLDLIGEWISATTDFNPNDMSYNNHGAKPSAFDFEAAFSFYILNDRPSSIGIGYGKSNQALSLGIPLTRRAVVFNTSIWRNTLQSIEVRRDRNYAASDTGNGPVAAQSVLNQTCTATACSQSGKADNVVTAQFDYYF